MSHTPGPWKECGHERKPCQCGQVWSETADVPVAKVERGEWGDRYPAIRVDENTGKAEAYMEFASYGSIPEEFSDANTWLIAAAPDLLAMCEEVLATVLMCRCDEAYTSRNCHEPNSSCYLQSSMEGVIAKAKGESK